MDPYSVAVISDIHGNRWALEAVLEDIASRKIDRIVNLGDCAYGPLDPAWTTRTLMERGIPSVRGNEDRILGDGGSNAETVRFVRKRLSSGQLNWLVSLPPSLSFDGDFFMCHGTPSADTEYLLRIIENGGTRLRSTSGVLSRLKSVKETVILCGHDHLPGALSLPGGRLVVNPGSVGLQAYTDDHPRSHAVETGLPQARYCIVSKKEKSAPGKSGGDENCPWKVEHVEVEYDLDAASFFALRNGRPDWAYWLLSGTALNGKKV